MKAEEFDPALVERSREILRTIPKPQDSLEYKEMAQTAFVEDPNTKFQLELQKWIKAKTQAGWTMRRIKRELKRKGLLDE